MFIKCLLCAENSHFCCFFLGHTLGGGWDGVDFFVLNLISIQSHVLSSTELEVSKHHPSQPLYNRPSQDCPGLLGSWSFQHLASILSMQTFLCSSRIPSFLLRQGQSFHFSKHSLFSVTAHLFRHRGVSNRGTKLGERRARDL